MRPYPISDLLLLVGLVRARYKRELDLAFAHYEGPGAGTWDPGDDRAAIACHAEAFEETRDRLIAALEELAPRALTDRECSAIRSFLASLNLDGGG